MYSQIPPQLLNPLATLAFYGSLVAYAIIGLVVGFSAKWIFDAWLLNRRAKQWAHRLLNAPQSSERACFKASRLAK